MIPQVDFDIVDSTLRVLEGWELGNKGLYRKYWSYIKNQKKLRFYFGPRSPKNRFLRFSLFFHEKKSGNLGISGETTIPGISSETTETRESRVSQKPGNLE